MERVLCRLNVYDPYKATAPADAALIAAAVNALPHLLAIAAAAEALERNRESGSRTWIDAVCDAVDAARKAGT